MAEILFLAHRAPWPPDRGDRIRSWQILRRLAEIAPVHVAGFTDSDDDRGVAAPVINALARSSYLETRRVSKTSAALHALPRLKPLSVGLFHSHSMADAIARIRKTHPITHIAVYSSQMAQYVPEDFAGRFLMDFVDVDSAKFAAYARDDSPLSPMRWVHAYEGWRLAAWERAVARRADTSLLVSAAEAALLRQHTGVDAARIHGVDNGIDLIRFCADGDWQPLPDDMRPMGPCVVFTGQMDYRPNIEAVRDFAHNALPLLRQQIPDVQFAIVGRAPTEEVQALAQLPGVIVTGEVADTRPWLAAASVVVAPLRIARGIQNKLLEAMAMGRPVVASSAAAEGIDVSIGTHLLVADGASQTVEAVTRLINDLDGATRMGHAARARMEDRYGWAAVLDGLPALLDPALAPHLDAVATEADRVGIAV